MIISLIVAIEQGGGIGREGGIPWHLRDDLKLFKQITMGHTLIMGRRTWDSIGRVLPGRTMLVLSQKPGNLGEGVQRFTSLHDALGRAREREEDECFIIGGAGVYADALSLAERIYVTWVQASVPCDTFFPDWEPDLWQIAEERTFDAGDGNEFAFIWQRLERGTE